MGKEKKFNESDGAFQFKFGSHGAKFLFSSNDLRIFKKIKSELPSLLPASLAFNEALEPSHRFHIQVKHEDGVFELFKDGEFITEGEKEDIFLNYTLSRLRLAVAEFSEENIFLHAGVVGWREKAIIIPANSFKGKTTLTTELIKRGATYLSDEYAVLDENSLVHPFPKTISMRGIIDQYMQTEIEVEDLGGRIETKPLAPGLVLITEYQEGAQWKPEILSAGKGIMEILPHTITINHKPQLALEVLKKLTGQAPIVKSKRGEAVDFASQLLDFFDSRLN